MNSSERLAQQILTELFLRFYLFQSYGLETKTHIRKVFENDNFCSITINFDISTGKVDVRATGNGESLEGERIETQF